MSFALGILLSIAVTMVTEIRSAAKRKRERFKNLPIAYRILCLNMAKK